MLPSFNDDGVLPPGIWPCEMAELAQRFAVFRRTDRRLRLYGQLENLLRETLRTGVVVEVIIDGSFVTDKDEPNDIDLILGLPSGYDLDAAPFWIGNVLDEKRLARRYKFDVRIAPIDNTRYFERLDLYQQIRDTSERKGVVRLLL